MRYKMTISGTLPYKLDWPLAEEVESWLEDTSFMLETLEVTETDDDNLDENGYMLYHYRNSEGLDIN